MSLIDQAAKNVSPYKLMMQEKASKNEDKQFIVQPTVLLNILNDEMATRVIDKKEKTIRWIPNASENCRMAFGWYFEFRR